MCVCLVWKKILWLGGGGRETTCASSVGGKTSSASLVGGKTN